jgi:hypothetical protein
MAHRSRKLTPKFLRRNQPQTGAMKGVNSKPQQKTQKQNRPSSMLVSAILLSSTGLIVAFTWVGILFISNPEQVDWLNKVLPDLVRIPLVNKK